MSDQPEALRLIQHMEDEWQEDWDGSAIEAELRRQHSEIETLKTEVAHWKANHACEVQRARILKERPDIPIERIQAYEQWGKDQADAERYRWVRQNSLTHPEPWNPDRWEIQSRPETFDEFVDANVNTARERKTNEENT